jgi:O-antigen ligase
MGYAFIAIALLQPAVCFRFPPSAFWWFAAYLSVYAFLGTTQGNAYTDLMVVRLFTLMQLLVLFWISLNLFQYEQICKQALVAFVSSCFVVVLLQLSIVITTGGSYQRLTAFGDNANEFGGKLGLGMLALVGVAYGRRLPDRTIGLLAWLGCVLAAAGIVLTGSRGAMLSVILGFAFLVIGGSSRAKLQVGLLAVGGVVFLISSVYSNDEVLRRWEMALVEGSMSGREDILPAAWNMFTEKPFLGWGPIVNYHELGSRFDRFDLDTHNTYLWILTETGLVGAFPFFVGLWLAVHAAWNARKGSEGNVPIAMLMCLLLINMSGTWHLRKLFWVTIAYALASGSMVVVKSHRSSYSRMRSRVADDLSFSSPVRLV